ncbi:hypothetical protein NDA16_001284 [Ustilago loliicola]|nr:hypothetical protein NDA16_001284 [Ustilago loliicola]
MHTLPASHVVGHDFLGNHIGELLIRQPVKRNAPPSRTNKTSSSGGTVCATDANTGRRASIASHHAPSVASSTSKSTDSSSATLALDSFLSVGAITPLGTSTDPIASLEHASESSSSEPSSVDSRSGSADVEALLHLNQLPLARTRHASEGGPTSPRVSFVTSFGAKSRRSAGSRRAPSEAGSSSYFGHTGSRMSSASMSPMEQQPGAITWNLPFRDQHQSFAQAIEHNASLNRNLSQQSHSSDAVSSQRSKPTTPFSSLEQEVATPTTSNGGAEAVMQNTKSQSFSATGLAQPIRQCLTRAATKSTLDPLAQVQQPLKSPGVSAGSSGCGLSYSNSMGASRSALRGHRKMPSLVPKGDDERTFCFVEPPSSSETDMDDNDAVAKEPQLAADTTLTSKPAQATSDVSDSTESYKDVVEVQYGAHHRADSRGQHPPRTFTPTSTGTSSDAQQQQQEKKDEQKSTPTAPVARDQDTPLVSLFAFKPPSVAAQKGRSRPVRKLRIQPNVQSRPSLLEKTMEDLRHTSRQAQAATANGVPAHSRSPAVTPNASEKVPDVPVGTEDAGERYDPVAYGPEQRTFRIQSPSTAAHTGAPGFPFAIISEGGNSERKEPASHARTSNWAREQNRLASSPPAHERDLSQSGYLDLQGSCASLPSVQPPAPTALLRHHTASHSSSSTESPSLLDTRELLSPPETAISTPELGSPPLFNKSSLGGGRRSSPLSS